MGVLGHEGFVLSGISARLEGLQGTSLLISPPHENSSKTPSMRSRLSESEVVSNFTSHYVRNRFLLSISFSA